jgi:beta-glucanase (GH16 family)
MTMKTIITRISLIALLFVTGTATVKAASLLANPGFESDAAGHQQNILGWTVYGQNFYNESGAPAHNGSSNYFKVYQTFSGGVNYTGIFQDYISGPGASYTADGWAYTLSTDTIGGQNLAWIEVSFRDAFGNILSLYRSALIGTNNIGAATGKFHVNTWTDLQVTNQYNPTTYLITNTTSTLVAPDNTYYVRYQIVFQGDAAFSGGSMYFDDLNLVSTGNSQYGNMNITWGDEFNGNSVNTATWTYDTGAGGWGNNELEYYTSRTNNAYVNGGILNIIAKRESFGCANYTSARMKSEGLVSWKYGRFEWRAAMPSGVGCWPALWLLGTNFSSIGWPKCGEIDVMENNGTNLSFIQGSLHSGSDETGVFNLLPGDSITNYHSYVLDWALSGTTGVFLYYVDGHLYQTQTNWTSAGGSYPFPFNQPFFIIMNLAIGGNYVQNPSTTLINAGTAFPVMLKVDYVRVYNLTSPLKLSVLHTNSQYKLSWPSNIVCHLQVATNSSGLISSSVWKDMSALTPPYVLAPTTSVAFYRLLSP